MIAFFSGGAKNGKSTLAQTLAKRLAGEGPLYYAATMIPRDDEDLARIARHLREREGWGFTTLDCGNRVTKRIIDKKINGTFLFDSVTALLANEMFPPAGPDLAAPERVKEDLLALADWAENIVFVSDFIFADAGRYDGLTQAYRAGLAAADRALCARADLVAEVCAGQTWIHKGAMPE